MIAAKHNRRKEPRRGGIIVQRLLFEFKTENAEWFSLVDLWYSVFSAWKNWYCNFKIIPLGFLLMLLKWNSSIYLSQVKVVKLKTKVRKIFKKVILMRENYMLWILFFSYQWRHEASIMAFKLKKIQAYLFWISSVIPAALNKSRFSLRIFSFNFIFKLPVLRTAGMSSQPGKSSITGVRQRPAFITLLLNTLNFEPPQ